MLDELLGPGFAVVGRDPSALTIREANRAWLASMQATILDVGALDIVRGHRDRLFDSHAGAIIRPDRYVFGVTDESHSLDDLVASLRRNLGAAATVQATMAVASDTQRTGATQ
jgi:hypothetical protein